MRDYLAAADPWQFAKIADDFRRVTGQWAAKSALNIALMDWVGKKLGVPLVPLLRPGSACRAGYDVFHRHRHSRDHTAEDAKARRYPILKVKVGLATDEATIEAVRSVTDKPLRVDANEGWKDREEAVAQDQLAGEARRGVHRAADAAEMGEDNAGFAAAYTSRSSRTRPACGPGCTEAAGIYDGVNIKLDKCGGILEAYRMIQIAKALGMKTMLGCMMSSSVTVTAAAHLSPLVDYRGPRRQSADRQRSVPRRARGERQADSA